MADPLNVLVLHRLGDPQTWRTSMVEHELALPMFAPEHNYLVHNAALPLPDFVRDLEFDAIVLCQTFLGRRRDPGEFQHVLDEYGFVAHSPAFKIGLPQDDYTCSGLLDTWMCDWNVDLVYPVCSMHWDALYPNYSKVGLLRLGYTGYISETMRRRWESPKPHRARRIDVSYRAANLAPNYGRLGYFKGIIGERFEAAAQGHGLNLDISTDARDTIVGFRWHEFVEDSRFVLGGNSGSSVLDTDGSIALRVHEYTTRHPKASFDEVEAACFPGVDGRYVFTAISPRNLECALIESAQVLTPGDYSGVLQPGVHYVPVEPDLSNAADVLAQIADVARGQALAREAKDAVLSHPHLRYEHHVAELVTEMANARTSSSRTSVSMAAQIERYRNHIARIEPAHWWRTRSIQRVRRTLAALGARRLKWMLIGGSYGRS